MNFLIQHLEKSICEYDGSIPLSIYLKAYFKNHPKLGSRDRRAINHGAFIYYRYANRLSPDLSPSEIIYYGLKESDTTNPFLETMLLKYDPELPSKAETFKIKQLIQLPTLSSGISDAGWLNSLLSQPDVFIRARDREITSTLDNAGIKYHLPQSDTQCVALPNGINLEQILSPESYVVQDWASQKSVEILLSHADNQHLKHVWDACAGAGGKSLMLTDSVTDIDIFATDIRKTILHNLTERFDRYQLKAPQTKVVDLADSKSISQKLKNRVFDLVICDVPCSGSGTWARTPENYHYFNPDSIAEMAKRQLKIASNTIPYLKTGGILAYITCSVFCDENEKVVEQLLNQQPLTCLHATFINGIDNRADSLFIAILQKNQ